MYIYIYDMFVRIWMHCAFLVHSLGSRVIRIPAQKGHPSKAGVKTLVAKSVDQCWNSGFAMFILSCLPFWLLFSHFQFVFHIFSKVSWCSILTAAQSCHDVKLVAQGYSVNLIYYYAECFRISMRLNVTNCNDNKSINLSLDSGHRCFMNKIFQVGLPNRQGRVPNRHSPEPIAALVSRE